MWNIGLILCVLLLTVILKHPVGVLCLVRYNGNKYMRRGIMITLTMKSTRNLSMICKHDDEKHNDEDADLNAQIMKSTMMKMPTRSEAGRMASV